MNERLNALYVDDYGRTPEQADAARPKINVLLRLLDDYGRSIAQGATFGFADELAAAGDATLGHLAGRGSQVGTWQDRYDANLAAERARDTAIPPVVSLPGQVAGGAAALAALPAGAALRAAPGVNRLFNVGRDMAPLDATVARGAMIGTGTGAAYGYGSGEGGTENRLASAGVNALAGLGLGATAPVVAGAAGRAALPAYSAVRNRLFWPAEPAPERLASRWVWFYDPKEFETDPRQIGTSPIINRPPQQPLATDYPPERWQNGPPIDASGNLTQDIDGRPLVAATVGGRRSTAGGAVDTPVPAAGIDALATQVTGRRPMVAPAGALPGESTNGVLLGPYFDRAVSDRPEFQILVRRGLTPESTAKVKAHETAHGIDELARYAPGNVVKLSGFDATGLTDQLEQIYSAGRTGQTGTRMLIGPRDFGYDPREVAVELRTEAIRAYMADPNWMKTNFPEVAARIRAHVNDNPYLRHIIQFNSLAPAAAGTTALGAAAAYGGGQDREQ